MTVKEPNTIFEPIPGNHSSQTHHIRQPPSIKCVHTRWRAQNRKLDYEGEKSNRNPKRNKERVWAKSMGSGKKPKCSHIFNIDPTCIKKMLHVSHCDSASVGILHMAIANHFFFKVDLWTTPFCPYSFEFAFAFAFVQIFTMIQPKFL